MTLWSTSSVVLHGTPGNCILTPVIGSVNSVVMLEFVFVPFVLDEVTVPSFVNNGVLGEEAASSLIGGKLL